MLTVLHHNQNDSNVCMDDIDHLFLLPERALQMDSSTLQKDLAGLDFDPRLMHAAPMGNIWLSGAGDIHLKHSRPIPPPKGGTLHWFACVGPEDPEARSESSEEREQRLRLLRDKQNEERQKKLEELKAQALAAQRYRDTMEEERRRRIETLRVRENDRRQQVGERKRLIYEAERDRRESILKKNLEREARFEMKRKNERSSLAFAFGSSTPRMLEPADTGGSFWGHRRATSTNNIMFAAVPLTRRSSERELDGSKKRATSAGGLDRTVVDGNGETIPAGCVSGHVGRRRTDLMPTIPTRDISSASSATSAARNKHFTKSPGPSRPDSSLSQQSTTSVQSSVNMRSRPVAAPRKPRPISIAVTGVTHDANKNPIISDNSHNKKSADHFKPPLPRSRKASVGKTAAEKQATAGAVKLSKTTSSPKTTPKVTPLQSPCTEAPSTTIGVTPPVSSVPVPPTESVVPADTFASPTVAPGIVSTEPKESPSKVPDILETNKQELNISEQSIPEESNQKVTVLEEPVIKSPEQQSTSNTKTSVTTEPQSQPPAMTATIEEPSLDAGDMTASMIAKVRITTEEEAKAALAERRRLAREEAERQAEAERLRVEEETRLEIERQRQEEEQARQMAEEQRHAEEERLAQAIRETQKREEEERLRREEEVKQKLEKEELERKAREESEKQRIEMQKRLEQEEKEREARRKRVEAIMLRTRSKGMPGTPKDENNTSISEKSSIDNSEESKNNQVNSLNNSTIESYEQHANEKEAALLNGSFNKSLSQEQKENGENHDAEPQHSNGHRNGVVTTEDYDKLNKSLIEHNVTNTLLDLGDLDPFKNANTSLENIPGEKITNEDSVNSNNAPESQHSTTDFLL